MRLIFKSNTEILVYSRGLHHRFTYMAILPNGTSIAISDLADCDRPLSCYLFLRIFARRLEFVHTIVQRRSSSLCTSGLLINEHSILPSVDRPQFVLCKWDIECLHRRRHSAACFAVHSCPRKRHRRCIARRRHDGRGRRHRA